MGEQRGPSLLAEDGRAEEALTVAPAPRQSQWLVGGGDMGELIRSLDWSATPLGPLESWPNSLRTTVSLCLSSNFPINILWGHASNQIYNDGYRVIVGEKHPAGMGMGYRECWESAWPQIGPPFERAWAGKASFLENQRMFLTRSGYLEETFFTFSLSPIRDEHGKVAGLFHPVIETTDQMLSERRTRALRELVAYPSEARTLETAFERCVEALAGHSLDLPFVLLYSLTKDGSEARLGSATGIDQGSLAAPLRIRVSEQGAGTWDPATILATDSIVEISELKLRFGEFACGPYPEGANLALARALRVPGVSAPLGIMVVGISPRLPFHREYRDHVEQLMSGTATALANALAYERERKRAEELAALDYAKTQFFSNISHEFRTPLTLMIGPLEDALADAEGLSPDMHDRLDVAHRNSLRLLRLVNSLLDFSRIEAGRSKAFYQRTDLGALTSDLAANFRSATQKAGLRLDIDCSPLPEPVYVDTEMWEKVVLNLVSNAFKFTFEGGITLRLEPFGDGVQLSVNDTGTGIPEDELPHLFARFHRVEGAQGRSYEGTGIGLALVQELVKLHGGSLTVDSMLGKGSTFRVWIPFGTAHLPAQQVHGARELDSTGTRAEAFVAEALRWLPEGMTVEAPGGELHEAMLRSGADSSVQRDGRKILVVDDNADMRDYLERLLTGSYEVLTASNGEEGLEVALRVCPDLVLADIMMPVLDGVGLLRALRSAPQTSTIPVIFLSARAGEEARSEGMAAGADDYLVKPFSARELLARVGSHIKLAGARKVAEQALRVSEERLRTLVTAASYSIYRMSPDWGEMRQLQGQGFLSDTVDPNFGWMAQYIVPEDHPTVLDAIDRAIQSKQLFELEHRVRRANGSIGWTLSRAAPMLDASGEIVEWIGSASDITDRKCAEAGLRDSEERFRLFVDNVHEYALMQADAEGKVTSWNPGAQRVFGYKPEEVIGTDFSRFMTAEDREAGVFRSEMAALAKHNRIEDARWMVRKDGSRFWARWITEPICDDNGELRAVAKVMRDETERERAEASVRRSLAEKEELLKEVHHRVKNNLQVITSLVNLQSRQIKDENVRTLFDETRNRILSIGSIHERLYRSDNFSEISISEYARQLLPELVHFYGVERRVSYAVEGDGARVELERAVPFALLLNELISNSLKHAFPGKRSGEIRVEVRSEEKTRIFVRDNGIGFPADFNPGTVSSLGVKLSRKLTSQMGGVISFSSNSGAIVEVSFPSVPQPEASTQGATDD